jgi:serine/threonine-protein kinase
LAHSIGNYQVIRELGEGHYGKVFLAVGNVPARGPKPPRKRVVAIKTLREDADPDGLALLLQEFALLDQVKHRSVVRVFEYIEDANAVVMEYIHGVSLQTVLDELERAREQVFTESVIEIGCEIADALYQAFTTPGDNGDPLQLVHRDLKPANVMLTPQGEVKVLDFGLARVDNADFAQDNPDRIRGTPIYMAPEQARGEAVSHPTDLFSLGLILYELLMKQAAYRVSMDAPDPVAEVFKAIEQGNVHQQCGELEHRLPGLGPIVTRLLQSRPQDRFQTGQDALVALRGQLYRDRGAYLTEFCEFFFGSIHTMGPAPKIEDFDGISPEIKQSGGGERKRLSIEERLRASMALDAKAKKELGVASKAARPASSGRASEPFSPAGRTPSQAEHAASKTVGERRPDETGMLQMESLSDSSGSHDAPADPNSTEFWALPTAKPDRSKPNPPPVLRPRTGPPPPPGGRQSAAPPPPSPTGPTAPTAAPPRPAPAPMAAGIAVDSRAVQKTPFRTGEPVAVASPAAHQRNENRVQSNRVYAIVVGMFALICVAVLALFFIDWGDKDPPVAQRDEVTSSKRADPDPDPPNNDDTGIAAPPPPKATRTRRTSTRASGASSPALQPPPECREAMWW